MSANKCIVAGDDGMYYDSQPQHIETVAALLGLKAKLAQKPTDAPITFLSRCYPTPKANGQSGTDLGRFLTNITMAPIKLNINALQQLFFKARSYLYTDHSTPVVGPVIRRILHEIDKSLKTCGATAQDLKFINDGFASSSYTIRQGHPIPLTGHSAEVYTQGLDLSLVEECNFFVDHGFDQLLYPQLEDFNPLRDPTQTSMEAEKTLNLREHNAINKMDLKLKDLRLQYPRYISILDSLTPEEVPQIPSRTTIKKFVAALAKYPPGYKVIHDMTPCSGLLTSTLPDSDYNVQLHTPFVSEYRRLRAVLKDQVHTYDQYEDGGYARIDHQIAHLRNLALNAGDDEPYFVIDLPFTDYLDASFNFRMAHQMVANSIHNSPNVLAIIPSTEADTIMSMTKNANYVTEPLNSSAYIIRPRRNNDPPHRPSPIPGLTIPLPHQPDNLQRHQREIILNAAQKDLVDECREVNANMPYITASQRAKQRKLANFYDTAIAIHDRNQQQRQEAHPAQALLGPDDFEAR